MDIVDPIVAAPAAGRGTINKRFLLSKEKVRDGSKREAGCAVLFGGSSSMC